MGWWGPYKRDEDRGGRVGATKRKREKERDEMQGGLQRKEREKEREREWERVREERGERKETRREKRWAGQGYSGVKEEARPMRPQA